MDSIKVTRPTFQQLFNVRQKLIQLMKRYGYHSRDIASWIEYHQRELDMQEFRDLMPMPIQSFWTGDRGIVYDVVPQSIGEFEVDDTIVSRSTNPMNDRILTRTVKNISDFIMLLYEMDQVNRIIEGRGSSGDVSYTGLANQILWTRRRAIRDWDKGWLDYRGQCDTEEDIVKRVHVRAIEDHSFALSQVWKLNSKAYGLSCPLSAILSLLMDKFGQDLRNHEKIPAIQEYCRGFEEGMTAEDFRDLLCMMGTTGKFEICNQELAFFFNILVLDPQLDGSMKCRFPFPETTILKADYSFFRRAVCTKSKHYLVLCEGHWYTFEQSSNKTVLSKMLEKPKPIRRSRTVQVIEHNYPVRFEEFYFPTFEQGKAELETIYQTRIIPRIKEKRNVFLHGMAGTGKSWLLERVMTDNQGKYVYGSFTAKIARKHGNTIHSLFCNLGPTPVVNPYLISSENKPTMIILDEIGTFKTKWFWNIDQALRKFTGVDEMCGGLILIMAGDYQQIPPITIQYGVKYEHHKAKHDIQKFSFNSYVVQNVIRDGGYIECRVPMRFIKDKDENQRDYAQAVFSLRKGTCTQWLKENFTSRVQVFEKSVLFDEMEKEGKLPFILAQQNKWCQDIHDTMIEYFREKEIECYSIEDLSKVEWGKETLPFKERKPKQCNPGRKCKDEEFYLCVGMKICLTNNKVRGYEYGGTLIYTDEGPKGEYVKLSNGDIAFIEEIHKDKKYIVIRLESDPKNYGKRRIYPFCGKTRRCKDTWPIKPGFCVTINIAQGTTQPKVWLYAPTLKNNELYEGQAYTALSRAEKWDGFKVLVNSVALRRLECFRVSTIVKTNPWSLQFCKDPYRTYTVPLYPYYWKGDGDEFKMPYFYDVNMQTGDTATFTIRDKRKEKFGGIQDKIRSQQLKTWRNTIVIDIETLANDLTKRLFPYCIAMEYYCEGVIMDPAERWGVEKKYRIDERRKIIFTWDDVEDPILEAAVLQIEIARRIFEISSEDQFTEEEWFAAHDDQEAKDEMIRVNNEHRAYHLSLLPLTSISYNGHGFDYIEMYNTILHKVQFSHEQFEIYPRGGSANKGFMFSVQESFVRQASEESDSEEEEDVEVKIQRKLWRSHDLMEVTGVFNSLAGLFDEQVIRPFVKDKEPTTKNIKAIREGLNNDLELAVLYNQDKQQCIRKWKCQDTEYWNKIRIEGKIRKLSDKTKEKLEMVYTTIQRMYDQGIWNEEHKDFCYDPSSILVNGMKKGIMPLKYMDRIKNRDQYLALGKVDLTKEIEVHEWESIFYPREMKVAKEYWTKEENWARLKDFDIKNEIYNYCHEDVTMTTCVYRGVDKKIYNSLKQVESIQGLKMSVLDFHTMTSLTNYQAALMYPPEVLGKGPRGVIVTEDALLDEQTYRLTQRTPGGKTLPRTFGWESSDGGESDYYVQLDCRGMYCGEMQNKKFPTGPYRIITDQTELEKIRHHFNEGGHFERFGYFMGIACSANDPRTLDPPIAKKVPEDYGLDIPLQWDEKRDKIIYENFPCAHRTSNAEMYDIVRGGGWIRKIYWIKKWSSSAYHTKDYMIQLSKNKTDAEARGDKGEKNIQKLMANGLFGNYLMKSDDISYTVYDRDDVHDIIEKLHFGNSKFQIEFTELLDGKIALKITNLNFEFSRKPNQIGAFVLDHSHMTMNELLYTANRNTRITPGLAEQTLANYGDTDSAALHRIALENILDEDDRRKRRGKRTLLYYMGELEEWDTQGQFADELLCDALAKKEYQLKIDFRKGICARIIGSFQPCPKCYAKKYIIPPVSFFEQEDAIVPPIREWETHYSFKSKGAPKGCACFPDEIILKELDLDTVWRQVEEKCNYQFQAGKNEWSYACMKLAVNHGVPMHTVKDDSLKRYLDEPDECNFGIYKVTDFSRTLFKKQWKGRYQVTRVDKQGKAFTSWVPNTFLEQGTYPEKCCPQHAVANHECNHPCCSKHIMDTYRHVCWAYALEKGQELANEYE